MFINTHIILIRHLEFHPIISIVTLIPPVVLLLLLPLTLDDDDKISPTSIVGSKRNNLLGTKQHESFIGMPCRAHGARSGLCLSSAVAQVQPYAPGTKWLSENQQ